MPRWDYAQIHVRWGYSEKVDFIRDAYLCYLKTDGATIMRPEKKQQTVKPVFGKPQTVEVAITNEEYWEWLNLKIAELGRDGWEMISAPVERLTGAGNSMSGGWSWTERWVFWFKRPTS